MRWRLAAAVCLICAGIGAHAEPARVVSINLCTDQMAMLLAAPGQLLSVSHLASDPRSSAMVDDAAAYPANHGRAEEIYLMRPDLVVAGSFSARATVSMLQRLGIPVVRFDPAYSLADVRARILKMGVALGRQDAARDMVARFDADLAALAAPSGPQPSAALYHANGYTASNNTLAGEILTAAGLRNIAAELEVSVAGTLPLEILALAAPDAVITARPYPGASRAEDIMDHPVVRSLRQSRSGATLTDHDWVCGTPYVLRAIADMVDLRKDLQDGSG